MLNWFAYYDTEVTHGAPASIKEPAEVDGSRDVLDLGRGILNVIFVSDFDCHTG